MREIFERVSSHLLQGFLIWIPMLATDDESQAEIQAAQFSEDRITQAWDGRQYLGKKVAQSLGLPVCIAWDVYLLYPPGVTYIGPVLPQPQVWMHQLDRGARNNYLEPTRLLLEVEKLAGPGK